MTTIDAIKLLFIDQIIQCVFLYIFIIIYAAMDWHEDNEKCLFTK